MGNDQQVEGEWDKAKGTVKEGVGDLTNDDKMKIEGQWDKAKGGIEKGVGDVRDAWDHPDEPAHQP